MNLGVVAYLGQLLYLKPPYKLHNTCLFKQILIRERRVPDKNYRNNETNVS